MSDNFFDMSEFIENKKTQDIQDEKESDDAEDVQIEEVEVQRVVVEELAADKAALHEKMEKAQSEISGLKEKVAALSAEIKAKDDEIDALKAQLEAKDAEKEALSGKIEALATENIVLKKQLDEKFLKELEQEPRNPNALALLDRDLDLPDRFPGETRDHVIEVIKEAREKAESEGRLRRAQLLEGVLVANEPCGYLAKKRAELQKLFAENGNIISGPVLEELNRDNISCRDGENYLLPQEILKRTY